MSELVRAIFRAARIEGAPAPYDTVILKAYYPADAQDTPEIRNTGAYPPDPASAPFPVIIFFNGINVPIESYQWLSVGMAQQGRVVVNLMWVSEDLPGSVSLTPGIDLAGLKPDTYGTLPTASALRAVLAELERIQQSGLLAGALDLSKIVLGGHSAGGTIALQNANPAWFPNVVGGFCCMGHTGASTMLGHAAGTVLPVHGDLPLLLIGGTQDGVIASSSHRYNMPEGNPTAILEATFERSFEGHPHAYLAIIDGANHFSVVHPQDQTTGRGFLDWPTQHHDFDLRSMILEIINLFVDASLNPSEPAFHALVEYGSTHPMMHNFQCK